MLRAVFIVSMSYSLSAMSLRHRRTIQYQLSSLYTLDHTPYTLCAVPAVPVFSYEP